MTFVVRRPVSFGTPITLSDLGGVIIDPGEERDLLDTFSDYDIASSSDLATAISSGTLERLDVVGGNTIPPTQAFDDTVIQNHIAEAFPHHPHNNKAQLDAITDAGSGAIMSANERSKLAGIEAAATADQTGPEILALLQAETPPLSLDVTSVSGSTKANLLDRSNHTGQQLSSTISDFDTSVDARIATQKGAASGLATLDANGKLPASQLTVTAIQALGNWDASTNTPTLTSGVGNQGDLYRVSVAGTTTLDGESVWDVGDEVMFNGTVWQKRDHTAVSAVASVNGYTGAVVLDTDDVAEGAGNKYFTDARVASSPSVVVNTAKVSADGSVGSHSDVDLTGVSANDVLMWNGSAFTPSPLSVASGDMHGVQARQSTSFNVTDVYTDIPLDTVDVQTNVNVAYRDSAITDRIVIAESGLYLVSYKLRTPYAEGRKTYSRIQLNDSSTVPGTDTYFKPSWQDESTLSTSVLVVLSAGDFLTLQARVSSGTRTIPESVLIVTRLKAPKGDKGDPGTPGSGSTVGVSENGSSLGVFSTIDFGFGVKATNAGSGTSLVSTERSILHLFNTSDQAFTGTAICDFDGMALDTGQGDFTDNGDGTVTVNFNGTVDVSYDISINRSDGGKSNAKIYVDKSGSEVPGTRSWMYLAKKDKSKNTSSLSEFRVTVAGGDVLSVKGNINYGYGDMEFMANSCRFKIERTS